MSAQIKKVKNGFLLCLFLLSINIGNFFIFFNPHPHGPWGSDHYSETAWNIAQGQGYSWSYPIDDVSMGPPYDLTAFRPPGYPIFVAFFYRVFGYKYLPVLMSQVVLNATVCFSVFYITKYIFGIEAAYLATFLFTVISTSTIYASTIFTETLTTFLLAQAILLFIIAIRKGRVLIFALGGVCMGFAILVKWGLFFMPLFLAVLIYLESNKENKRFAAKSLAIYLTFVMLTIAPWLGRNYILTKELTFSSPAQGGLVLHMGALESGKFFRRWYINPRAPLAYLNTYSYSERLPVNFECKIQGGYLPIRKVQLYYSLDNETAYFPIDMRNVVRNIYRCEIPPQQSGTKMRYFISTEDSLGNITKSPLHAPEETFAYYATSKFLEDNDTDGSLINIFDIAEIAGILNSPDTALDSNILGRLDLNKDNKLDINDIIIAKCAILEKEEDMFFSNSIIDSVKLADSKGQTIVLTFKDNSKLKIPQPFGGKITNIVLDGSQMSIAFKLMNGTRDKNALRFIFDKMDRKTRDSLNIKFNPKNRGYLFSPEKNAYDPKLNNASGRMKLSSYKEKSKRGVIKIIDVAVDHRGIKWELNNGKLQYILAFDYIKHNFLDFFLTTLKRMGRMWITVGSSDIATSHPPPNNKVILMRLATFISLFVLCLGVCGILSSLKKLRDCAPVLVPIIYFPLTHAVYVVDARQTVPAQPYLLIFGAVFLWKLYNLMQTKLKINPI